MSNLIDLTNRIVELSNEFNLDTTSKDITSIFVRETDEEKLKILKDLVRQSISNEELAIYTKAGYIVLNLTEQEHIDYLDSLLKKFNL